VYVKSLLCVGKSMHESIETIERKRKIYWIGPISSLSTFDLG
jgi:hypothetical protein